MPGLQYLAFLSYWGKTNSEVKLPPTPAQIKLRAKYYLVKSQDTRKIGLEGWKKNIIKIYYIEKQRCFNDSKKETKF